jgi:hypothetical protein
MPFPRLIEPIGRVDNALFFVPNSFVVKLVGGVQNFSHI